jgi:hypothetical protein
MTVYFADSCIVGTNIKVIATPTQTGTVVRKNILGIASSIVVRFNAGPLYSSGYTKLYFCDYTNQFQLA